MLSVVFVAVSLALSASAVVTPLEPAPGLNFLPGGDCKIIWEADSTGTWTQTYIQLMSGSNDVMTHLTTVHGPFDGTSTAQTEFTYTCPDVTIHAPVLFYQFTSQASLADPDQVQWTGRFSISPANEIGAAPLTDADGTPYGNAQLVNPAAAIAAPPTAPGGSGTVETPTPNPTPNPTTTQGAPTSTRTTSSTDNHANPGVHTPTKTTGPQASTTDKPDAAVSLRGSAAALFAAAAAAIALL